VPSAWEKVTFTSVIWGMLSSAARTIAALAVNGIAVDGTPLEREEE